MSRRVLIALIFLLAIAGLLGLTIHHDGSTKVPSAAEKKSEERLPTPAAETASAFSWQPPLGGPAMTSALDATPLHLRPASSPRPHRVRLQETSQKLPDLPVDQLIALNRERALAGDAQAAYQIGAALWQCNRLPKRARDIALGPAPQDTLGFYEESLHSAQMWLDRCQRIGAKDQAQMLPWLELAAQNGSLEAMLLYGTAAIGEMTPEEMLADPRALMRHKERSLQYLFAAANNGSVTTLSEIAHAYRNGVMVKADPVLAYAYEIAYFDTGPATPFAGPQLDFFSKDLSDEERERARRIADRIRLACCG